MFGRSVRRVGAVAVIAAALAAWITASGSPAAAAEQDGVSAEAEPGANAARAAAETAADRRFWSWFAAHDDMLFDWTRSAGDAERRERIFDQVEDELHRVDPQLYFLFGPKRADGKREFIITGEGRQRLVPVVQRLTRAAPSLDRWIIIAFRPRNPQPEGVTYQDIALCACDAFFTANRYGDKLQLSMYIPDGLMGRPTTQTAAMLLLHDVLGELDMMTYVRGVDLWGTSYADSNSVLPITSLPRFVDSVLK